MNTMEWLLVISIFVGYAIEAEPRIRINRGPFLIPVSYGNPGRPPQGHPLPPGGGGQHWPGQMSPPADYVPPWDFRPGPGQQGQGPSYVRPPSPQGQGPSYVRPPSPQGQGPSYVTPPSWMPPQWRRY
ncbi:unnamed protein product [Cylicocyclus nassatus]|uniref:Uncharacterized protein n=1 Tax=Cylicocyclus nassatus TaxID=53992 RepID=A0AA36DQL9_CYLNA|nr:unnamed protein product [Cylicocyclus nassatus]